MDPIALDKKLQQALFQRNAACLVAAALLFSTSLLSIAAFRKNEKTVLVPLGFQSNMEISNKEISASYLEEMTSFYLAMLLDVTPKNVTYRFRQILKHTAPASYHSMEKYLKDEEKKYKSYNLSTSFVVEDMDILPDSLSVVVKGRLTSKFIEKGTFEKAATYKISYENVRGMLLIKEFNRVSQ